MGSYVGIDLHRRRSGGGRVERGRDSAVVVSDRQHASQPGRRGGRRRRRGGGGDEGDVGVVLGGRCDRRVRRGITFVHVDGGRRAADIMLSSAGEICGHHVQPPTSIVAHTFTGTATIEKAAGPDARAERRSSRSAWPPTEAPASSLPLVTSCH